MNDISPKKTEACPGNILVVDDAPENLVVVRKLLSMAGHRVFPALDAERAFSVISCHTPDLILLDIMMPGMDGFEACRRLKAAPETWDIPVVFLTSSSQIDDMVKGFSLGGMDYVVKPFHKEELLARVSVQLELKRNRDALLEVNSRLREEIRIRKLAETALENERNIVRDILDAAAALVLVLTPDYRIELMNQKGEQFLECDPGAAAGAFFFDLFCFENKGEQMQKALEALLAGKDQPPSLLSQGFFETTVIMADARRRQLLWQGRSRKGPDRAVTGVILSSLDITEIRKAEDQRVEQEKLRAALEMAGAVSHELNQPLQSISSISEILKMKYTDKPDILKKSEMIMAQLRRIGRLTEKLRHLPRYITREYVDNIRILDIETASQTPSGKKPDSG